MLFQKNIEPHCTYCAKGAPLSDGHILCAKKGIVEPGGKCPRFRYDPLKRVPPRLVGLDTSKLQEEDFRLD